MSDTLKINKIIDISANIIDKVAAPISEGQKVVADNYCVWNWRVITIILMSIIFFSVFIKHFASKKNLFTEKNTYIMAVCLLVIFILFFIDTILYCHLGGEVIISSLLGLINVVITCFLVVNAYKQNQIQKDNIKLQMFDKRYKVFQTIADARSLINREDHIMIGVYKNEYLSSLGAEVNNMYNQLKDVLFLSQTLFDHAIYLKIGEILSLFNNVRQEYYQLGLNGLKFNDQITQEKKLRIEQTLVLYANDVEKMNSELNQILPGFSDCLKDWQKSVIAFNDYVDNSGIKDDFDKYIMIHNLDK